MRFRKNSLSSRQCQRSPGLKESTARHVHPTATPPFPSIRLSQGQEIAAVPIPLAPHVENHPYWQKDQRGEILIMGLSKAFGLLFFFIYGRGLVLTILIML